jgi:CRP-like cAMP-binding protein
MNGSAQVTEDVLAKLVPLDGLRPESRADVLRNAKLRVFEPGEFLFRVHEGVESAFYLVEGSVELVDERGSIVARLSGESPESRYRLAHQSPRTLGARCRTAARCVVIDGHLLDVLLTWDQTGALEVGEVTANSSTETDDWMMRLLQMPAFQQVPPNNLQAMFMRLQRIDTDPGQVIVQQGEPGDYFYVVTDGRCIVTREQPNQKAVRLAELEPGACFGEEALIADSPRNATVTMLTRGVLMRLSKNDFRTLLNDPLARRLSHAEAAQRVAAGSARYLDVRLPSEFQTRALPDSLNLPLYMLRMRLNQLEAGVSYICVCDTARRSSVASFVLTQKGFDAYILDQGLDGAD